MSLDYRLTNVKDWSTVCFKPDDTMNPTTEAVIFLTMATGIGDITDKTAPEFYARISAWEKVVGTMLRTPDGTPRPITPVDVRQHIGLWTNASRLTKTQFAAKLFRNASEDAGRQWDKS